MSKAFASPRCAGLILPAVIAALFLIASDLKSDEKTATPVVLVRSATQPASPITLAKIRVPGPARSASPLPQSLDTPIPLAANAVYVVDSDDVSATYIIVASPQGLVTLTHDTGPIKVRSLFWDSSKMETRTFTGNVTIVEPAGKGRVELLVVPSTAKTENDVIRRVLDVDVSTPPAPKPPDPPKPPPDPPKPPLPDTLTQVFQTAFDKDNDADKGRKLSFLAACYAGMGRTSQTVNLKTVGDASTFIKGVVHSNTGLAQTDIVNLRRAIAAELTSLGTDPKASLDVSQFSAELDKIAKALNGVR